MKKILLLFCLISGALTSAFAQLGKIQYEDAEQHFAEGKYKEAIKLLDDAERSLGKANPFIEHLRILSRLELAKKDLSANFDQVAPAKKEAQAFLKKYETDANVEDRYRDVYKALKELNAFPDRAGMEKLEAEKKAAKEMAVELEKVIAWAQEKAAAYKWKPDQTEAEFRSNNYSIGNYRWNRYSYNNGTLVGRHVGSPLSVGGYLVEGPASYQIDNNGRVSNFSYTIRKGKNEVEAFNKAYYALGNEMAALAGSLAGYLITQNEKVSNQNAWIMIAVPVSPHKPEEIAYYISYTVSHIQKWSSISIIFSKEKVAPL